MQPYLWAVLCSILMVGSVGMEIITPTFGIFTGIAVGFGVGSSILAFMDSSSMGFVFTALNMILFPASYYVFFRWIGQSRMMNQAEIQPVAPVEESAVSPTHPLMGQTGKTVTMLRPGGQAEIGGKRMDVMAQGKFIDANKNIKVIKVSSGDIIVEEA